MALNIRDCYLSKSRAQSKITGHGKHKDLDISLLMKKSSHMLLTEGNTYTIDEEVEGRHILKGFTLLSNSLLEGNTYTIDEEVEGRHILSLNEITSISTVLPPVFARSGKPVFVDILEKGSNNRDHVVAHVLCEVWAKFGLK